MKKTFAKASIPGLANMYVAGIYRSPNKPVCNFIKFITGAMEYTNRFHTVFPGDSNSDVMKNSNVTHNYINKFHQNSLGNESNLTNYIWSSTGSGLSSIVLRLA